MSNVVGERFQITIDRRVREELRIRPGDRAIERVENGRMVVDFMPRPHRRSLLGALKRPGQQPVSDWEAVKDRAWATRTTEIAAVLEADTMRRGTKRAR